MHDVDENSAPDSMPFSREEVSEIGSSDSPNRVRDLAWLVWLGLLVVIPVTSFPILSTLGGTETPVAPLALLPLGILAVLTLGPHLIRGGRLPASAGPLLGFALLALVSALAAFALRIEPYKGQTVLDREVRALATLAMGLAFYLCAVILVDRPSRLEASLKAITWGGLGLLAWSAVQAIVVLKAPDHVPLVVTQMQHWISVRDPLLDRVTGMAYEPSWLGNQLVVLYLPIWFANLVRRRHSPSPSGRAWPQLLLLVAGVAILVLTRSRISLLSGLVIAATITIASGWRGAAGRIDRWLPVRSNSLRASLTSGLTALAMLALVISAVVGAAAWIRRTDPRMAGLADIEGRVSEAAYLYPNEAGFEVANRLAFAERLVYWTAAMRTFGQFPLLGVGPGNAGFFFEENRPAYGYKLTEIRNVLNAPSSGFPNPKNLWLRILAENGIIGFSAFAAWFGLMGIAGLWLWRHGRGAESAIGLAGAIGCAAQVVEGFSLDTYALPHFWVLLGLVTAAGWNLQRAMRRAGDPP